MRKMYEQMLEKSILVTAGDSHCWAKLTKLESGNFVNLPSGDNPHWDK
ncbi:9129_t:CDS:2 [Diversispora eburnea]|uniref:9129_t:CDS:1 n=1 Tax=Diversispora eburnea TaxID=1213867 RepID=A0A9N8ZQH8_9GLOM|nr:9129_t:CDS:2 [Diversispora eburnea]